MSKSSSFKIIMSSCLSIALFLIAGPALALIEGELSVGNRTGNFSKKSLSGTTIQVAGHLDPIILVPVSFGVRVINDTFNPSVADHSLKSLTATAIVPEVSAWINLGDIRPFARLGYTLVSAYKGTMETTVLNNTVSGDVAYKSTGVRMAAGVNYSFMPLVSLSAALEQSTEKLSVSEKLAGVTFESDYDFNNTALIVGVKAGI
jgi:hypothetical protein